MSELSLRIVLVPKHPCSAEDKTSLLSAVETCIRNCDVEVVSVGFFEAIKPESQEVTEIEELIVRVHTKVGITSPKQSKYLQYQHFCAKWGERCRQSLPSCSASYVLLYSKDSFVRSMCPQTKIKTCDVIGIGILPHNGQFHQYASLKSYDHSIHFYHDTRNVILKRGQFEMSFSYANIRNVFVCPPEKVNTRMYFDLFNPPIVHRLEVRNGRLGTYSLKHRNVDMHDVIDDEDMLWMMMDEEEFELSCAPQLDVDVLGRSCVLRLSCLLSEADEIVANIHRRCGEKSILFANIVDVERFRPTDPIVPETMDFDCLYLMTALFKRNFVLLAQSSDVNRELSRLANFSRANSTALERALTVVLSALDSGRVINFWHAIDSAYDRYVADATKAADFRECIVPSKCCLTRRITLTPTRQLLWRPELLFGNRVLRNFDSEFAIRVSFRDDNLQKLSAAVAYADEGFLKSVIQEPMTRGIQIGQRRYEFLAWSNSQIRDHGVWMYSRDSHGKTSADIRGWMGNFSHIRNVPKYMARMGQCFSQTEDALSVPLSSTSIETVPDIEGGYDPENRRQYCFSDGIGRISTELAAEVHDALGHDKLCSAFQIRYGGYKGMLAVDPSLKHVQIQFRKSMEKFTCDNSTRLEIARTSAPISLHLNRPFIAILNDLGVRHRVFMRLQEDALRSLTDMLFDEGKAADCLRFRTPSGIYPYEELSKSGIHLTTEPYFRSILLALHRYQIDCLKSRANVPIDPRYGRNMLGVLDETGILNYGQVFVQYSVDVSYGETTKDTNVLTGEVLVTKNPCHYPGDVRKFQAVDVPALRHHVDTIVFPRRGPRPHPSEMAGSDLDGDEYAVLWLPELLFEGPNHPPAHFPNLKSSDVPVVTVPDMINCLQEYIKKDQVGIISHAHLALADQFGVKSNICQAIARKISIAVDFAKTGENAYLKKEEKPNEYPDFMEKSFGQEYKSSKALGKMYRICKDYEMENQETGIAYCSIKVDPDLVYPGWEKYKESALESRNKYNSILSSLLSNYGIGHEVEGFSGAFTKLHCRFQERKDRAEVEKVILVCLKKLAKDTDKEFHEEFPDCCDVTTRVNAMLQKASAWYVVTYSDPNSKFLSFPWTTAKYLADIKIRRTLGELPPFSPAILELDEKIAECEEKLPQESDPAAPVWKLYQIICQPPELMKRALRVLILWAQDEEIIEKPGEHQNKKLLFESVFVKLVFLVAEKQHYVARITLGDDFEKKSAKHYSAGKLCIEFLKFCSSLRFYNSKEIKEVLPFNVYKYSRLAKRAVVSYHRFALTGKFRNLYYWSDAPLVDDLIEMRPFPVDSRIFGQIPIAEAKLRRAEGILTRYSGVEEVGLNEYQQTKRVWVRAQGSERAIKELKSILRKKHKVLKELFETGVLPEDDISQDSVGLKREIAEEVNSCTTAAKIPKLELI